MTLSIDDQKCQGHGRCVLINMDLFDVGDDGNGIVVVAEPDETYTADIEKAIVSCPEQAITFG